MAKCVRTGDTVNTRRFLLRLYSLSPASTVLVHGQRIHRSCRLNGIHRPRASKTRATLNHLLPRQIEHVEGAARSGDPILDDLVLAAFKEQRLVSENLVHKGFHLLFAPTGTYQKGCLEQIQCSGEQDIHKMMEPVTFNSLLYR